MKTIIIYCHPHVDSHNAKILKNVVETLDKNGSEYEVLDLYRMDFNAFFSEMEYYNMVNRIRETQPDVKKLQDKISVADNLIFIYPVWWYNMPARLKGFMDRVFCAGFAYRFKKTSKFEEFGANIISYIPGIRYLLQPYAVQGNMKDKKAFIFRSYGGPPFGRRFFGNTSHKVLEQVILRFIGITGVKVYELYNCDKDIYTKEYEESYMAKVRSVVGEI